MDIHNLVKMANQIGQFFEPWPDQEAARQEVASHITRFWEPRMRKAIFAHLQATGAESGLMPLVVAALASMDKDKEPA